jgi:hypothetical protein
MALYLDPRMACHSNTCGALPYSSPACSLSQSGLVTPASRPKRISSSSRYRVAVRLGGGVPTSIHPENIPVWWEVTLDGHRDLIVVSEEGLQPVEICAGNELPLAVVHTPAGLWGRVGGLQQVTVPVDTNGDGHEEQLTIGLRTNL